MADPSAQFRRLPSIAVIAQGPTHHTALPPQGAEPARRLSIKTCRNRGAFAPDVAITCGARGAESASRNGPCFCRSEEHTSELQSLMRISYAVFCLKKKNTTIYKNVTNVSEN